MNAQQQGGEVARIRAGVSADGLLAEDREIVVMLSGGQDSVCLLDVAVALRGANAVRALHVNYGLREQADAEERHCARLCERLAVELRVLHARRPHALPPQGPANTDERCERAHAGEGGNLQAWAREVRYASAAAMARERAALVATGHTASDQVETILYRLAASPGRRPLLGMSVDEGGVIRPLLAFTREQTAAYCRQRGLEWCDDESNRDPRYARARVRHGLVPALRAVHPAAEANVLRTAGMLREDAELLETLVERELEGSEQISIARLEQLHPALARAVVVRLAERAAGTYVPQAGRRVGELLALARLGRRAELHVGGGAGAVVEAGELRMIRLPPRPR
jgi:tRNA(Ile)-lysidine synthase